REQRIAPVQQRLQCLVTERRNARTMPQQTKSIVQSCRDVLDGECPDADGCQLDSERYAIEPPTDSSDGIRIIGVHVKARLSRLRPVDEKTRRCHFEQTFGVGYVRRAWNGQRSDGPSG